MIPMFSIFRILVSTIGFTVVALVILYFLPHDIKMKALGAISSVAPESVGAEVKDLLLTPPESRAELLKKLETNLDALKDNASEATKKVIESSEKILTELKVKNEEQSLKEAVQEKFVSDFIGSNKTQESCVVK